MTVCKSCDYYWAGSFTPTRSSISQLSLHVKRVGTPATGLQGGIYTDNADKPGTQVCGFNFDSEYIGLTADWFPIATAGSLIVGNKHWIVIQKVGDASNYYVWDNDGLTAGEHSYSSDGATWTTVTSSYQFAFKTQYDQRVLASAEDATNVGAYEWREILEKDESILDTDTAKAYAEALLATLTDESPELSDIAIVKPQQVPAQNTFVTCVFPSVDVNDTFDVQTVQIDWMGGYIGTRAMTLTIGRHADALAEFLASLKLKTDRANASDLGTGETIDIMRSLADTMALTVAEVVVATVNTRTSYIAEEFNSQADWTVETGCCWTIESDGASTYLTQTCACVNTYHTIRYSGSASLPATGYYVETRVRTRQNEFSEHKMTLRGDTTDYTQGSYEIDCSTYYDYVRVRSWQGGCCTCLACVYNTPYPQSLNTWYILRVYQRNNGAGWDVTVWLDGVEVIAYNDAVRNSSLGTKVRLHLFRVCQPCTFDWDYFYVWTEA